MSGSGAGLNRYSATILDGVNANTTAITNPLAGYGTTGYNDTGIVGAEARNWTKWAFQMRQNGTSAATFEVSIYGTVSEAAYIQWMQAFNPGQSVSSFFGTVTVNASDWFLLPGPSEQSGTGSISNPLTTTSPFLEYSGALIAVRAVLTTQGTAGSISIVVTASP